jgi:hypothetical protein
MNFPTYNTNHALTALTALEGRRTSHKEINTGLSGSGKTVWMVCTVCVNGSWKHVERFDNEAEARHWMKWA